jgi:hypothetical protein
MHKLINQIPINYIQTTFYKLKNTNIAQKQILEAVSVEFKMLRICASVEILPKIYVRKNNVDNNIVNVTICN